MTQNKLSEIKSALAGLAVFDEVDAMKAGWGYLSNNKEEVCKNVYGEEAREVVTFEQGARWSANKIRHIVKALETATKCLETIACLHEGDEVTGSFDSPWNAKEARETLSAIHELLVGGGENGEP